jgi:adenine-specific DNA-methyltransferase
MRSKCLDQSRTTRPEQGKQRMPTLNWIGKEAVANHHRQVPYRLLRCDKSLSAGDPDAGNLLVQGDNLEALKALLPYYAGKVKCIYIDPPYNTGNENWVYNDNVNSPEIKRWLGQVVGREAEDLSRHDKWLCMMYPRLALLRDFLSEDGVICVSIDDEEGASLKFLLDELFGRQNFIAHIVWQKRYVSNVTAKFLSDMHDHILVYGFKAENVKVRLVQRTEAQESDYKNRDNDPRGPWRAQDLSASKPYTAGIFTITGPDGTEFNPPPGRYWRMNREQYERWIADDAITFGTTGKGRPMLKRFLTDVRSGLTPNTWWSHEFAGHNKEATLELKQIFDGTAPFDTPKPVKLLSRILELFSDQNSLILDSFAGSATTGHAVLAANRIDNGARRFVLVEMDEQIAKQASAERLRRVCEGHVGRVSLTSTKTVDPLGGGFRFCTLGKPLFDENGQIDAEVSFADLAAHIFFVETGTPIPKRASEKSPLLGVFDGRAIYLLFNGILGDKRPQGGNVLTAKVLRDLPPHDGPKVVYGEGCRLGASRLLNARVTFKQMPYGIGVE